jgi:hypothetical protein
MGCAAVDNRLPALRGVTFRAAGSVFIITRNLTGSGAIRRVAEASDMLARQPVDLAIA